MPCLFLDDKYGTYKIMDIAINYKVNGERGMLILSQAHAVPLAACVLPSILRRLLRPSCVADPTASCVSLRGL